MATTDRGAELAVQAAAQESNAENGLALDLHAGEVGLIMRALRYYVKSEQQSITDALLAARASKRKKDVLHFEDVKRQSTSHIEAAQQLQSKLRERMLNHANS